MGELTARYCFSFCLVLHGYFSVFNKLTSVEDCLFSNLAMTPAHTHTRLHDPGLFSSTGLLLL